NGVARPVLEMERNGRNDEEGSFTHFGRALGPSAQSHPGFGHYLTSRWVNTEVEY
ncbi:unnamed protein product, partial [Symbiodinium sp. CCMP2456]